MTGPMGARTNREVALVTDDFRLYHRLAPFFEAHGLMLHGIAPGEPAPAAAKVVLGGPPDDARSLPVAAHRDATLLATLQRLDVGTARYRRVVFGIDPGKTIGIAIVADDAALYVAESIGVDPTVQRVARWSRTLQADTMAVHVGDGAREVGIAIIAALGKAEPHLPRHLVPERDTTPWSPVTGSRHTDAALRIARRVPEDP